MRTKTARSRSMMTAADMLDGARPFANAMVERAERQAGSRMTAYEIVASTVGVTPGWLRKFLGRQPDVRIEAHEFFNIVSAYRSICERIEAERDRERQKLTKLREGADAALQGDLGLVLGLARAPGRGEEA